MKRLISLFLTLLVLYSISFGQIVFIVDSVPELTSKSDTLFLASELYGWNPCDKRMAFVRIGSCYQLVLHNANKSFYYKITRGDWHSVEVDANGNDISNRIYAAGQDTVRIRIAAWRDAQNSGEKKSTASANVRYLPFQFEIKKLNRLRTIRLYLPPNYFKKQQFPVIYMQDGQNVFDELTAFANEWRVDEILDSLYKARGFEAIVVAIYNDGKNRLNEYSPWRNDSLGFGGQGKLYADFLATELKPYIDKHFRTNHRPEFNAVVGSSMGGLISLYAFLEYPNLFGRAAVFSPSLWFSPKVFDYVAKCKRKTDQRLYLLVGEQEGDRMVQDIKLLEGLLYHSGYNEDYVRLKIAPDGKHSEWFWSREFIPAIEYLFDLQKK